MSCDTQVFHDDNARILDDFVALENNRDLEEWTSGVLDIDFRLLKDYKGLF